MTNSRNSITTCQGWEGGIARCSAAGGLRENMSLETEPPLKTLDKIEIEMLTRLHRPLSSSLFFRSQARTRLSLKFINYQRLKIKYY